jgi:transcriptional regulator with XRE-family HTH domain
MDDSNNLSGRLQHLREAGGHSTRKVAAGAGMARTTYERRELDATNLTLKEMRGLSAFYGLTVAELVEPADEESPASPTSPELVTA